MAGGWQDVCICDFDIAKECIADMILCDLKLTLPRMARKMPIAIVLPGEPADAELATMNMTKVERRLFELVRVHGIAMPCEIFAEPKCCWAAVDRALERLAVALLVPAARQLAMEFSLVAPASKPVC
jgi:hypothetical protein